MYAFQVTVLADHLRGTRYDRLTPEQAYATLMTEGRYRQLAGVRFMTAREVAAARRQDPSIEPHIVVSEAQMAGVPRGEILRMPDHLDYASFLAAWRQAGRSRRKEE